MMNYRASIQLTPSVAMAMCLIAAQPAHAQNTPDSTRANAASPDGMITVTAQRRAELSRDVPIAITTLSAKSLEQAGAQQLADIAQLTPAMRFDNSGSFFQATIRGVGTAITTSGGGPNVGIYVDGFFSANPEVSDFDLMNVQSIQVLKGPQGTLFGRNTTGGAILVTTADPSTTPGAEAKISYGSFNTFRGQAYATFGLSHDVAMDIEGMYARGDGYTRNIYDNNPDYGQWQNWSIRTGIKATLAPGVSVLVRYTHSETNDPTSVLTNAYVDTTGQAGFFNQVSPAGQAIYGTNSSKGAVLLSNYYLGLSSPPAYATAPGLMNSSVATVFRNKTDAVQATIKADLGFANLTSYSQWRRDDAVNNQTLDPDALAIFNMDLGIPDRTLSQEFLLSSKPGGRLQWTAGLDYFQYRDGYIVQDLVDGVVYPFGGSSTMSKSYAAFADATYAITPDRLFLTLGGRYSHDTVTDAWFNTTPGQTTITDVNNNPACAIGGTYPACTVDVAGGTRINVPSLTNNQFTPRVVLRYKPSHESSVYASWTRGYKAGILNVGGSSLAPVKPEKIDAFEGGYKYETRRLAFDLAGYYYNYRNLQVSSFDTGQAQIRNAASSEIYGLEANLRYTIGDLDLNAGGAWLHARYKSFPNAPYYTYCDPTTGTASTLYCTYGVGTLVQSTVNASGFHMQRAPDFTANFSPSWHTPLAGGKLTLAGNLYYTSSFYFDPAQQFKQNGYATVSLKAQWQDPSKHYTVAIYGENLSNIRYRTSLLVQTMGIGNTWNAPATWGISLDYKL